MSTSRSGSGHRRKSSSSAVAALESLRASIAITRRPAGFCRSIACYSRLTVCSIRQRVCRGRCNARSSLLTSVRSSRHLSHKRAKRNTTPNTSLLQIEGVGTKEAARYAGAQSFGFNDADTFQVLRGKVRLSTPAMCFAEMDLILIGAWLMSTLPHGRFAGCVAYRDGDSLLIAVRPTPVSSGERSPGRMETAAW
jgi:hypothetical protein